MNLCIKRSINMTLVVASCIAVVACGGSDEIGGASSEDSFAATDAWEKASASCPCTLWPTTAVPPVVAASDTASVNLGVKFASDVNGYVTGLRFYKGAGNEGTHVGSLWSSSGQLLAQATFAGETSTGWQTVTFSAPVAITAGASYTASYFAPAGRYATDQSYFSRAFVASPLRATAGVYKYDGSSSFPSSEWNASNYWVDVMFTTTTTPASEAGAATLAWNASPGAVAGYRVYYGTAPRTYMQPVGSGTYSTRTGASIPGLTPGATYYFAVTAVDSAGSESAYSDEVSKRVE
jgi:hypothetical protein